MNQSATNFEQSLERSPAPYHKEETPVRRGQASGSHARNKSYDFLMANRGQAKAAGVAANTQKSVISMWGFLSGLGVEDSFDKIGEIDEEIADISFADGHVFLLTEGNNILVRGKNDSKQLGFDPKETLLSFKVLSLPSTVKYVRVECGGDFTFAVGRDGEVFSWGLNIKGQLGHGHFDPVSSAAQLRYLTYSAEGRSPRPSRRGKEAGDDLKLVAGERVMDVACGALHTILLTSKGRVFASGYNETFALGVGAGENQCTFCEVPFFSSSQFTERGVTRLAAGVSHSAVIAQDTAFVWGVWGSKPGMASQTPTPVAFGSGKLPLLGMGISSSEIPVDIRLGDLLTVFLTNRGEVFTMGDNINGQLGLGESRSSNQAPTKVNLDSPVNNIACGSNHVFCYSRDWRTVFAWGSNLQGQISPVPGAPKKISTPIKQTHLLSSLPTRIVCRSRATVAVSRLPIDIGKCDSGKQPLGDAGKKLEMQLFAERAEKDNAKKLVSQISTENTQLRQELLQLKTALANAERSTKRALTASIGIQANFDLDDGDPAFDGNPDLTSDAAFQEKAERRKNC